jgi:lysophospholipase L1-like esterase
MIYLIFSLAFALLFAAIYFYIHKNVEGHRPLTFPRVGEVPHRAAEHKRVVVCIGDSITHGNVSINYVDMLQNTLGTDFYLYNAGVNSDTSYTLLERMAEIITTQPDFVTLLIGTNDVNATLSDAALENYWKGGKIAQGHTPTFAEYQANYAKIVAILKAQTRAKISLLSLPLISEEIGSEANLRAAEYNAFIQKTAAQEGLIYVPLHETMLDYLHKNPKSKPLRYTFEDTRRLLMLTIGAQQMCGISFDTLSRYWGLDLLTDNLHLNTRAATMVKDLILGANKFVG